MTAGRSAGLAGRDTGGSTGSAVRRNATTGARVSSRVRICSSEGAAAALPRANQRVWQAVHCTWRPAAGIMPSGTSYSASQFGQVSRIGTSVGGPARRPNRVSSVLAAAGGGSKRRALRRAAGPV